MIVAKLIEELQNCDQDAEVGWDVGTRDLSLLIGKDPDAGESITIERPTWL